MSVEDTLTERGKRYGDFTDHAEICQRIKLAMIAGSARWARLSDVQKQALEVIADKIARILSGDPNYADNWHDIQGYAKLVEDRLPKAPMTFSERCAEIDAQVQDAARKALAPDNQRVKPPFDDIYAHFAAHMGVPGRTTGRTVGMNPALGAGYELAALCPECEYPDDGTGTHYATCSKLTAPKEFVAEVEATFDALEARCPGCGVEPLVMHQPGCPVALESEEPAAAIDDDSPRRQAIDQNGNDGAVYEDPWYGAPEWAKYKAQDADGNWYWYEIRVSPLSDQWAETDKFGQLEIVDANDPPNPNWRDTLIERT